MIKNRIYTNGSKYLRLGAFTDDTSQAFVTDILELKSYYENLEKIRDYREISFEQMLADTGKHTHNQYLTLLITFGLVGFILIAFYFVRAFHRHRLWRNPVAAAYLCILLVSFITEDTLETLAGAVFSSYFMCFFSTTATNETMQPCDQIETDN